MSSAFLPPLSLPCPPRLRHALTPLRQSFHPAPARPAMQLLDWLFPRASRTTPIPPPSGHAVLPHAPAPPEGGWQAPLREATFGLGCFWGAERKFWEAPGVWTTSVGYGGGAKENPTYREVCSGRTGHAELVNVVYDERETGYEALLDVFWAAHDPTTKNRQGNDVGTQYRSVIFYHDEEQKRIAEETRAHFDALLGKAGRPKTVTEIEPAPAYYFAEEYHQQYLHKNPGGYCGLGGTGMYRPREKAEKAT